MLHAEILTAGFSILILQIPVDWSRNFSLQALGINSSKRLLPSLVKKVCVPVFRGDINHNSWYLKEMLLVLPFFYLKQNIPLFFWHFVCPKIIVESLFFLFVCLWVVPSFKLKAETSNQQVTKAHGKSRLIKLANLTLFCFQRNTPIIIKLWQLKCLFTSCCISSKQTNNQK